jgi:hypothetical protein
VKSTIYDFVPHSKDRSDLNGAHRIFSSIAVARATRTDAGHNLSTFIFRLSFPPLTATYCDIYEVPANLVLYIEIEKYVSPAYFGRVFMLASMCRITVILDFRSP